MFGAIAFPSTYAASQRAVMVSGQPVVMACARVPGDAAAVQHCLEYLSSTHPDFEVEGGCAWVVVRFEGVLPEAAPCVAFAPINLEGPVGLVVDIPPEVYILLPLAIHLTCCLYAGDGGGLRHPLHAIRHLHVTLHPRLEMQRSGRIEGT